MASETEREPTYFPSINYERMDQKTLTHLETCMFDEIHTLLGDSFPQERFDEINLKCVKFIKSAALLMYMTYERMDKMSELEDCKDAIKKYVYVDSKTSCIYICSMGELVRIKVTDTGIMLDIKYSDIYEM